MLLLISTLNQLQWWSCWGRVSLQKPKLPQFYTIQSSDTLQHSQNRLTRDSWIKLWNATIQILRENSTNPSNMQNNIVLSEISSILLLSGKLWHWQYCCHVSFRRICSVPVHCCISESWKLSLYKQWKHYLHSTYAYTNRKVRVMRCILAMAEVPATLVQKCFIRDFGEFGT